MRQKTTTLVKTNAKRMFCDKADGSKGKNEKKKAEQREIHKKQNQQRTVEMRGNWLLGLGPGLGMISLVWLQGTGGGTGGTCTFQYLTCHPSKK